MAKKLIIKRKGKERNEVKEEKKNEEKMEEKAYALNMDYIKARNTPNSEIVITHPDWVKKK